LNRVHLKPTF